MPAHFLCLNCSSTTYTFYMYCTASNKTVMLLFVPVKLCFSMTGTRLGRENRFSIFDHFWQVTSERWHCRPRNLFRIGGYKDDNLCRVVVSRNGSKPTSYFGQGRCGKEYMSGDAVLRR
jgi:hypothetical protein